MSIHAYCTFLLLSFKCPLYILNVDFLANIGFKVLSASKWITFLTLVCPVYSNFGQVLCLFDACVFVVTIVFLFLLVLKAFVGF